MPLFLEPSAWTRLYVEEEGTEAMRRLFARPDLRADGFFMSAAVVLEMYGSLAKDLRRGEDVAAKEARGEVDEERRRRILRRLRKGNRRKYRTAVDEFERDLDGLNEVDLTWEIYRAATEMARRAPERAVSSMDWLHLATLLHLSAELFRVGLPENVVLVSSDEPLNRVAKDRGVDVFDPLSDDPDQIAPPLLPL
jgi:predicted nucleic acid-binding protein